MINNRKVIVIRTEPELVEAANVLNQSEELAFDWETTGLRFWREDFLPLGLALAIREDEGYYIPMNHRLPMAGSLFSGDGSVILDTNVPSISLKAVQTYVYPLLLSKDIIAHNLKFDGQVCERFGMPVWNRVRQEHAYDTYLAAGLLNEYSGSLSLKELAKNWLGLPAQEITELNAKANLQEVDVKLVAEYAVADACNTYALKKYTEKKLKTSRALSDIFWKLEMPIVETVAKMEQTGILLDKPGLRKADECALHQMACALKKMRQIVGFQFNPQKGSHISTALYDQLGLQPSMKKGVDNTDRKQIEIHFDLLDKERRKELAPFVKAYLAYKDAMKIHTTYTQTLIDLSHNGRVHPTFWQMGGRTGRFASQRPNGQNIPKACGPLDVRAKILSDPGHVFILADFKGVEFLITAAISADKFLVQAARDPSLDVHENTARRIFDLSEDQKPSKEQRDKGKTATYGIIFGVTAQGLAKQLSTTISGAAKLIKSVYEAYPGLRTWEDKANAFILTHGYAKTYFGRRRWANKTNLDAKEPYLRESELRKIRNVEIQGTSADLTKRAIKKCSEAITEQGLKTRIVLQVHDELVFLTPYEEIDIVAAIAQKWMPYTLFAGKPNAVHLPIDMEIKFNLSKDKRAKCPNQFLAKHAPGVLNGQ